MQAPSQWSGWPIQWSPLTRSPSPPNPPIPSISPLRPSLQVVASDGHTYERDAITAVIAQQGAVSPLTREPLGQHVLPNWTLLRHIQGYDEEMMRAAELASMAAVRAERERKNDGLAEGGKTTSSRAASPRNSKPRTPSPRQQRASSPRAQQRKGK